MNRTERREAKDRAKLATLEAQIARQHGVTLKQARELQYLKYRVGIWNWIAKRTERRPA